MPESDGPSGESRSSLAKQESSVRHLQQLYTIVAGLALSDAVGQLFTENGSWRARATLLLLFAFVVTLVPFYHGALRHLDDVYLIDASTHQVRRAGLAVDFVFLFAESCLLVAMAHRLADPTGFLSLFLSLLLTDIVWSVAQHFAAPRTRRVAAELQLLFRSPRSSFVYPMVWAKNNLLFVVFTIAGWTAAGMWLALGDTTHAALLALLTLARTANDYRSSWDFYFPPPQQGELPQTTVIL